MKLLKRSLIFSAVFFLLVVFGVAVAQLPTKQPLTLRKWQALGSGFDNTVRALTFGDNLYAGGDFHYAGGVLVNHVAKWNGSAWSALGPTVKTGAISATPGVNGPVYALTYYSPRLYVGGSFSQAGGFLSAKNIASWNSSDNSWAALFVGANAPVKALARHPSDFSIYVGNQSSPPAYGFGAWSGSWAGAPLTQLCGPVSSVVYTLSGYGSGFGKGIFAGVGSNVKLWDGTNWVTVGSFNGPVNAVAFNSANIVYAAGDFTMTGGVTVNHVAQWNGSNWEPVGLGFNGNVYALAYDPISKNLYAGGAFTKAGEVSVNHVAQWDGTNWYIVGSGVTGTPYALAVDSSGNLYAGGAFLYTGDRVLVNNIAKY